jgi:nitrogenase iron protein NifH
MGKKIKQIAIYGKGGIGKSTTTSNISAALADSGLKVMQVGCDPKSDSTNTLRGGQYIPTVLDTLREGVHARAEDIVHKGYAGVYCVEAGGPAPGVGCAGRGIISAVETLKQLNVFDDLGLDVVIFDVLGDVVCGGFAVPIREGIADSVFTVSSADFMAVYAANNLFKGIKKYSASGGALLGGVIANSINTPAASGIIDDFALRTKTDIMAKVPRSITVTQSELQGKTVIEAAPDSGQAKVYRDLAKRVISVEDLRTPSPMDEKELRAWAGDWAKQLLLQETGVVLTASAI